MTDQPIDVLALCVDQQGDGQRLDQFLATSPEVNLSRKKVKAYIDRGWVEVNGHRERFAKRKVKCGDRLKMAVPREAAVTAGGHSRPTLDRSHVLYLDDQVAVLNKPPHVPSQPVADVERLDIATLFASLGGSEYQGFAVVHRLDAETSGAIVLTRGAEAASWMTEQFRERTVTKRYWAWVLGRPKEQAFERRSYLSEIHKELGLVREVRAGGKLAQTAFEVLEYREDLGVARLLCCPETGRSHQIRVHLAALGLPILGDKRYGPSLVNIAPSLRSLASNHHLLHAREIVISIRRGQLPQPFVAEPPPAFGALSPAPSPES